MIISILTGTLVPMATTTSPIVNLSTPRMQPALPTTVTIAKLRTAIHTTDMKNDRTKNFCNRGFAQSGIVQLNATTNGNETRNRSQWRISFKQLKQPRSSSALDGTCDDNNNNNAYKVTMISGLSGLYRKV